MRLIEVLFQIEDYYMAFQSHIYRFHLNTRLHQRQSEMSDELLTIISIYPLILLMAWFYYSWHTRVEKLRLIEPMKSRKNIVFRFASLRMGCLFLWGATELTYTVSIFFKYLEEGFNPFALFLVNSEPADIPNSLERCEELFHLLRGVPSLHGSNP